jgi:hypothetical protein
MSKPNWRSMNEQELTELFRKLGAQNPEGWAHSQITEGILQLPRFLFLREAWKRIVNPNDHRWMDEVRPNDPNEPGGELGPAIERLLAAGGRLEDITTVARVMQWWLLAGLCVLIDQPLDLGEATDDIWWGLFLVDENGHPTEPVDALIESVLETDPTGMEMRPPEYFQNLDTRDPPG